MKKCVMLTGDRKEAAEGIAAELGIDEVHAELLPQDKVSQVERLLKEENWGKRSWHLSATVSTMRRCSPERISALQWEVWALTRRLRRQMWS